MPVSKIRKSNKNKKNNKKISQASIAKEKFEFITNKNLLCLKSPDDSRLLYIGIRTDAVGDKEYSHISRLHHLIEILYEDDGTIIEF